MFGDMHRDSMAREEKLKFLILCLLYKLKIAGAKKLSFSMATALMNNKSFAPKLPKYAIQLAIVSLSLDFIVMVPYRDRDTSILP